MYCSVNDYEKNTELTYTGASVFIEAIPASTGTQEGAGAVQTRVITSSVGSQTLIYICNQSI